MLSGASVQRQQAIPVKARPLAVGAIEVIRRRTEWEKGDAVFRVDGQIAPRIVSANVFPCVLRESIVMRLPGVGHSVELPDEFSGNHVISSQVSGRRNIFFARSGTKNHQILKDLARTSGLHPAHGADIALKSPAKIHDAFLSETHYGESGQ